MHERTREVQKKMEDRERRREREKREWTKYCYRRDVCFMPYDERSYDGDRDYGRHEYERNRARERRGGDYDRDRDYDKDRDYDRDRPFCAIANATVLKTGRKRALPPPKTHGSAMCPPMSSASSVPTIRAPVPSPPPPVATPALPTKPEEDHEELMPRKRGERLRSNAKLGQSGFTNLIVRMKRNLVTMKNLQDFRRRGRQLREV